MRREAIACALTSVALVTAAAAQDATTDGASVGTVHDGRLIDGAALPLRGPGFHFESNRDNHAARYGTAELVGALTRAAGEVAARWPGSDLLIEDLSLPEGGPITGHGSHRSGRDADVAYYARDAEGARLDPTVSIWFERSGRARGGTARFDAERVAALYALLLDDPSVRVTYVFMAPHLQRLVLRETPRADRPRLQRVLRTPRGRNMDPHADHFHVRIACPRDDVPRGCVD